jgi:hypothetical protein
VLYLGQIKYHITKGWHNEKQYKQTEPISGTA